jgi:hypothetical protein
VSPPEHEDLAVALRRLLHVTGASLQQRAHLENALESRIVVEQAKGMLAERLGSASRRRTSCSGARRARTADVSTIWRAR